MTTEGSVVLYVDDDPANNRLMAKLFERFRAHHELISATSGLEAVALAETKHPQLVLLDLNLPDISGAEVLEALRLKSNVPVVMLSGDAFEATRRRMIDLGADAYITKPFNATEMFRIVDSLLSLDRQGVATG